LGGMHAGGTMSESTARRESGAVITQRTALHEKRAQFERGTSVTQSEGVCKEEEETKEES